VHFGFVGKVPFELLQFFSSNEIKQGRICSNSKQKLLQQEKEEKEEKVHYFNNMLSSFCWLVMI